MRSLLSKLDRYLAPPPDSERVGWLGQWTYAHRGLHGDGRVENSPSAFRAAVEAGLGVECDIQRSLDSEAIVFHDWDLSRLLGRPDAGEALSADQWKALRYAASDDAPITLADLLHMVAGKVPLLIEIKSKPGYDVEWTCMSVSNALYGYNGLCAVMSFDPRVSRWFRRDDCQVVRGLVIREDGKGHTQKAWQRHLALWIARPDFIAYHVEALPNRFVAGLREYGLPVLTWTVKTPELLARANLHADAPIAEGEGLP